MRVLYNMSGDASTTCNTFHVHLNEILKTVIDQNTNQISDIDKYL